MTLLERTNTSVSEQASRSAQAAQSAQHSTQTHGASRTELYGIANVACLQNLPVSQPSNSPSATLCCALTSHPPLTRSDPDSMHQEDWLGNTSLWDVPFGLESRAQQYRTTLLLKLRSIGPAVPTLIRPYCRRPTERGHGIEMFPSGLWA